MPEAQAIDSPSGAHRQLLALRTTARKRAVSPSACTKSESPAVKAMVRPSRAHSAEVIGLPGRRRTSCRVGPPDAGALNTAPRARKSTRAPSGDQVGADCTVSESAVRGMTRSPEICRTKTRVWVAVPAS